MIRAFAVQQTLSERNSIQSVQTVAAAADEKTYKSLLIYLPDVLKFLYKFWSSKQVKLTRMAKVFVK